VADRAYSLGMRIVSLVPHATELLFALGLGEQVLAVTHECDHPPAALERTRVTRDRLPSGLGAAQIDAAVRERTLAGEAIYELDREALAELEPDLIVTQALCPVCAVSYDDVAELARGLPSRPRVIALDPHTFGETLADVRTLAQATGTRDAGIDLVARIAGRVDRVRLAVRGEQRPRVAALEWLDPVFAAGHWTPQLIELAGGTDVLGLPGEPSATVSWQEVAAAEPEVVVVMPCGYDAPRAHAEALAYAGELAALGARRVVAVNASAYFSRPGPRLVEGLELLAQILHPRAVGQGGAAAALPVELAGAGR
jgi:iron complex transport system substrate-binding protein